MTETKQRADQARKPTVAGLESELRAARLKLADVEHEQALQVTRLKLAVLIAVAAVVIALAARGEVVRLAAEVAA